MSMLIQSSVTLIAPHLVYIGGKKPINFGNTSRGVGPDDFTALATKLGKAEDASTPPRHVI